MLVSFLENDFRLLKMGKSDVQVDSYTSTYKGASQMDTWNLIDWAFKAQGQVMSNCFKTSCFFCL